MPKIILFFLLLFPLFGYSQSVVCPQKSPTYTVEVEETPLSYDTSLYSKQLKSHYEQGQFVLGEFNKKIGIQASSNLNKVSNPYSQCTYIVSIKLKIQFIPTIYISKESQQFQCSYNSVLRHENTHYQIEKNALEELVVQMPKLLKQYFDNSPISYNNNIDLNNYVKQQSNNLLSDINNFIQNRTLPYHQALDSPENYKKESLICGIREAQLLNSLLSR